MKSVMISRLKKGYVLPWLGWLSHHKLQVLGLLLVLVWCLPYVSTGQRIEYGDFSFFTQAYEAIRISIIDYHQFPWWNPWMSGGVPLFANPQIGLFSIQTIPVLLFGAVIGLKVSLVIYTLLGYASMLLLLQRYFKVKQNIAIPLALIWIFCSFFVAHLPVHFTFVWYMLTPLFVYLCLTLNSMKSAILLGLAFSLMGLSQLHNAFFHLLLICFVIILWRIITAKHANRIVLIKASLIAVGIFIALCGYRLLITASNVRSFSRIGIDDARITMEAALTGPFVPLSITHPFTWLYNPAWLHYSGSVWGYSEITATIGVFTFIAALFLIVHLVTHRREDGHKKEILLLIAAAIFFSLALGKYSEYSSYALLKHLPVFSEMRVSTRWFIFFDFCILLFIGQMTVSAIKNRSSYNVIVIFLWLGVTQLFLSNAGYQATIFQHNPVSPRGNVTDYSFEQIKVYGSSHKIIDGRTVQNTPDGNSTFREYEATLHNQGVIYSNDALVTISPSTAKRTNGVCAIEEGCTYIRSSNAQLLYWSPNKVVLKRSGSGPIILNSTISNYFLINGRPIAGNAVTEPYTPFSIDDPSDTITLTIRPPL